MRFLHQASRFLLWVTVAGVASWALTGCKHKPAATAEPSYAAVEQDDCLQNMPPEPLSFVDKKAGYILRYFLRDDCHITGDAVALRTAVTMTSEGPVSRQAAWEAFNSALLASGHKVEVTDRYYKLVEYEPAEPSISTPGNLSPDLIECLKRMPPEQLSLVNKSVYYLFRHFLREGCPGFSIDATAPQEPVTVVTREPVSGQEAWAAFVSALQAVGYFIVRTDGHYKVVPSHQRLEPE